MRTIKEMARGILGPDAMRRMKVIRRRPDLALPLAFRKSSYGPRLAGPWLDQTYSFALTDGYGDFISGWINSLPEDAAFLDIGANIGLYSILAARRLLRGHVYAFEPNVDVYLYALRNIHKEGRGNVDCFNVALTENETAVRSLFKTSGHSGKASLLPVGYGGSLAVSVPASIVSGLLDQWPYAAVKLDVEGYELPILKGLATMANFSRVHWLVVEISESTQGANGVRELEAFFHDHGFKKQASSGDGPHRDEIYSR